MSREYSDYKIEEFCSAGAKQYGMRLRHLKTGEIKYVLKLRGITLDMENAKKFQYEHLKTMVLQFGSYRKNNIIGEYDIKDDNEECVKEFNYSRKFGPDKFSRLLTRCDVKKQYKPVNQKGLIREYVVYPFGY